MKSLTRIRSILTVAALAACSGTAFGSLAPPPATTAIVGAEGTASGLLAYRVAPGIAALQQDHDASLPNVLLPPVLSQVVGLGEVLRSATLKRGSDSGADGTVEHTRDLV